MYERLTEDYAHTAAVLDEAAAEAKRFLAELQDMPAGGVLPAAVEPDDLPDEGLGARDTLEYFKKHYASWMSGSAGPRFFGLVTGGVTPAALAGDWLVSVYDQNAVGSDESAAPFLEAAAIRLARQLFLLPDDYSGTFVTGATMSNFVGLALARQWLGRQSGIDIAQEGLWGMEPVKVFSGTPHSSVYKALSMLGMGRGALTEVECLPDREAVNVDILEDHLKRQNGKPCIVVANAGTVNTVDFDDIASIVELQKQYRFWLHVDAAFGGFAACSPVYRSCTRGMEFTDSITIDAHKWLNVPYDAAMQFTRHQDLQAEVFQNAAEYLEQTISSSNFIHLTPENSRRFRALPSWFTLMAYGRRGYAEIVERNCRLAHWMGQKIDESDIFELLSPVRMNGICFTFRNRKKTSIEDIRAYLKRLQANGGVFLTPTVYQDVPAVRVSITNWRTTQADVDLAWEVMQHEAAPYC